MPEFPDEPWQTKVAMLDVSTNQALVRRNSAAPRLATPSRTGAGALGLDGDKPGPRSQSLLTISNCTLLKSDST